MHIYFESEIFSRMNEDYHLFIKETFTSALK